MSARPAGAGRHSAIVDALHAETADLPFPCLLQTAAQPVDGRGVSLVAADPFAILVARGPRVELHWEGRTTEREADAFEELRALLASLRGEPVVAVGYLGYDLGALIERLPRRAVDDQGFPDLFVGVYEGARLVDHATGRVQILGARRRAPALSGGGIDERFVSAPRPVGSNFAREAYLAAIVRAREAIAAGEIYQVNLSQRFAARFGAGPRRLYSRLRAASPAPYAACLEFGNRAVVSSSPEEYLTVRARRVRTTPIKGTRRRGSTAAEDAALRDELLASAKDAAELTMIVDLERNDLGRVCEPGSVHVVKNRRVESHETVWHLSSTIEGRLEPGADLVSLIEATFPGGSVTGAPKIRAMELIDELEPTRRGVFTGALVFMTPDGDMVSSIAIRTMQVHEDLVTFQAGGAIVWDSDPVVEYEETLTKARAMARAAGVSLPG